MSDTAGVNIGITSGSVARALNVLGDPWSCLILFTAFQRCRRFDDWQQRLGISRGVLSLRLKDLLVQQIMVKKPYGSAGGRFQYHLTQKGRDLYPWVLAAWDWEQHWSLPGSSSVAAMRHQSCGEQLQPRFVCGHCRSDVLRHEVVVSQGPGCDHVPQQTTKTNRRLNSQLEVKNVSQWAGYFSTMLSDRWSCLIILICFDGAQKYAGLCKALNISTKVLAERMDSLVNQGIIAKQQYQQRPARFQYQLSDKGKAMYPIFLMLKNWSDRWLSGPEGAPEELRHKLCGQRLNVQAVCNHCRAIIDARDVTSQ